MYVYYGFFFFVNQNMLQIVGANRGGVVAIVEALRGFVPFSQISTVCSTTYFLPCV